MEKENAEEKEGEPSSGLSSDADPDQPEREHHPGNDGGEIRSNAEQAPAGAGREGRADAADEVREVEERPKDEILPLDDQVSGGIASASSADFA